jgi:hypothetical protein
MKDEVDERRHEGWRGLSRGGRIDVFNDEQLLSWAHEAKFASGELFDGRRIFLEPARLFAQPGVFAAQASEVGCELIIPLSRPRRGDDTLVANQRIDDEHADDEEEDTPQQAASPPLGLRRR